MVRDVAVRGVPDREWGQRVEAVVQVPSLPDTTDDLERELIAFARERIASYKCPRGVRFVAEPLHDERGKLSHGVLDETE